MDGIYWPLRILTFFSSIYLIKSVPEEQPLIFHPETLEIYSNWKSTPKNGDPYAVACPAELDEEIQFNLQSSLDRKSLFVRDYSIQKTESIQSISILCNEYYKMAVVLHTNADSAEKFVEFGHEVYIDREKFTQTFKTSDFKNFGPLLPLYSFAKQSTNSVINLSTDNSPSSLAEDNSDIKHSADTLNNNEKDFVWLSRVTMKYDFSTWNLENLTYYVTQNAQDMRVPCTDSDLGKQFYGDDNLDSYYSNRNQQRVFGQIILPKNAFSEGSTCKLDKRCVTSYTLLWPYQFRSSPSKPISCSEIPTIPVWHETAEDLLDYTEKFLVAMAVVTNQRLKVIVGTHKILTFPKKDNETPQQMYLLKDKIPIPEIIYKIVKYKSHDCDTEKEVCWFDAVIVIHNQPDIEPKIKLCQDRTQEWGWESIQFLSTTDRDAQSKWRLVYVCKIDEDVEKELWYKNDTLKKGDLKLNQFPYYNGKTGEIEFQNWQKKFDNEMYDLFE